MSTFLNNLVATRKRFFNALIGDNQLMTIADGNTIINGLNNLFRYRMYDFSVSQTGVANPIVTTLAAGASDCGGSQCNCTLSDCDCTSPCRWETGTGPSVIADFARTAPGTYTLTVTLPASYLAKVGKPVKRVALMVGPLTTYGYQVVVNPTAALNVVIVKTYDATGTLADAILNNTNMELKVYF